MRVIPFILMAVGLWVIYLVAAGIRRRVKRQRVRSAPFPTDWVPILRRNLPPYEKLSGAQRHELHQRVQVFLADIAFEGCGGLEINDEIRVTIAAQACLLLIGRSGGGYPQLRSVVVYPDTYVAGGKGIFGAQQQSTSVRLGESWGHGVVVLSWCNVKQGALNFRDGQNVTLHEFAHQLDQEDGAADGAPILQARSAYTSWARIFAKEFERLQRNAKKGRRTVLDTYGTTNPAEFFAVATEAFFEKPVQLQKKHPELYEELAAYYQTNPAEWA